MTTIDVQAGTAPRFLMHPLWKWLPNKKFNKHLQNVNSFMQSILSYYPYLFP